MKEVLTRRELFKKMISKDTVKQVAGAWYGFTEPLTGAASRPAKKESLFEKVQRLEGLNNKKSNETLRKEG